VRGLGALLIGVGSLKWAGSLARTLGYGMIEGDSDSLWCYARGFLMSALSRWRCPLRSVACWGLPLQAITPTRVTSWSTSPVLITRLPGIQEMRMATNEFPLSYWKRINRLLPLAEMRMAQSILPAAMVISLGLSTKSPNTVSISLASRNNSRHL
jgi:hypothetical protein